MKILEKIIMAISKIMSEIAAWLVLGLILIICIDVIVRYIFNSPIGWVYEMSYIFGAFIGALGIARLMLEGGNVSVDLFYSKFDRKIRCIIDTVFGVVIFFPAYTFLTFAVIKNCITAYRSGETSVITTWYPKVWPIKLVLCSGLVMFLIVYALLISKKIYELIKILKKGVPK